MRINVHGGHARIGSRGAVGYIDEVVYDRKITRAVCKRLRKKGHTVTNISVRSGSQQSVLYDLLDRDKKHPADVNISIHLNAGGGQGFEIYYPSNKLARERAHAITKYICSETGFKERQEKQGNSLFVCNHLKNCYLLEVGFCDNKMDSAYVKKHWKHIAKVIADAISLYM